MGKQRSEMLQLYRQAYRTKLRLVLYFVGCPWTNNRLFLIGNQQFPERCGTLLETLNYSHSIIKIYKNSLYINSLITRRFHNTMNNAMPRI